jgi:hypothetical protein
MTSQRGRTFGATAMLMLYHARKSGFISRIRAKRGVIGKLLRFAPYV